MKTMTITKFIRENPNLSVKDTIAGLKGHGIKAKPQSVYQARNQIKKIDSNKTAPKEFSGTGFKVVAVSPSVLDLADAVDHLQSILEISRKVGGTKRVRELVDILEKLQK